MEKSTQTEAEISNNIMKNSQASDEQRLNYELQTNLFNKLQRSGYLNETLSVLLKIKFLVSEAKKNWFYNMILLTDHNLLLEDVLREISEAPYIVRKPISKMLFYSPKKIAMSINKFHKFRLGFLVFIVFVVMVLLAWYFLQWTSVFIWLIVVSCLIISVYLLADYAWAYYSSMIRFSENFENLLDIIKQADKEWLNSFLKSLQSVLDYQTKITEIAIENKLEETHKFYSLQMRNNLILLTTEVAEKEFELRRKLVIKDKFLDKEKFEIQTKIQNMQNDSEVRHLRKRLEAQGVVREHEIALATIKNMIQIAKSKKDSNNSKNIQGLICALASFGSLFEKYGERAWQKIDFSYLMERVQPITVNVSATAMGNSKNDFSKAQFGGGYAENVHGNQEGGTINNSSQPQDLAQAAAEIQNLLVQLSSTNPTGTDSEKHLVVEKAIAKIKENTTLKNRLIAALKSGSIEAFKETLNHPLANILVATLDGWQEGK